MNSETTPALAPPAAKNPSANVAGHSQERGSRAARPTASNIHGSSAYGSTTGVVAPATTTYGFAAYTNPAATRPTACRRLATSSRTATHWYSSTAPPPATISSNARHSRSASHGLAPSARTPSSTKAIGALPVSRLGCPRLGSGRQTDSAMRSARPGDWYSSGRVSGVNQPQSAANTDATMARPMTT